MAKSKKKPTTYSDLDIFEGPLKGKPAQPIAALMRDVLRVDEPAAQNVLQAVDLFKMDARFVVVDEGVQSTVRLVGEEPSGEPQDITAEATATADRPAPTLSGEECGKLADEACGTVDGEPVPTIGEKLEQDAAQEAATTKRVEVVEHVEVESSLDSMTIVRLKQVKQAIDAQQNTIHHLKEDLKEHTKRLEVLEAERDQLIDGEIPPTQMGNKDPEQTPIAKAARGETPMIVEPPVAGLIRKQGAEQALQGRTELDCPYNREKDARAVSMWFDGFREAKREDHTERPAIVQALTRDQMGDACLPCNGILQPGENTPKVATVTWDHRPTLVLDMLADGEGPVAGIERWQLLPTYDRDEWANLFAETYGPAIADVDANDEAKAKRIAGGINAGRLVKCGRSKRVVGPLSTLSIATVKTEPAEEQPPY